MRNKPLAKSYSLAEDIPNSLSYVVRVMFDIVGLVFMLNQVGEAEVNAFTVTSYSLYGGSIILLYLGSTLYHAISHPAEKRWLEEVRPQRDLSVDRRYLYAVFIDRPGLAAGQMADGGYLGDGGGWRSLLVGRDFLRLGHIPLNHAIWHGFVLGGTVCHFLVIYFFIA